MSRRLPESIHLSQSKHAPAAGADMLPLPKKALRKRQPLKSYQFCVIDRVSTFLMTLKWCLLVVHHISDRCDFAEPHSDASVASFDLMRNLQDVDEEFVPPDSSFGAEPVLKGPDGRLFNPQNLCDFLELGSPDFECCHIRFPGRESHHSDDRLPVVRFQRQGRKNIRSSAGRFESPSSHARTPK